VLITGEQPLPRLIAHPLAEGSLKERFRPIYQGVPQDTRSPWQITASIVEVSLEPAPFGTGGLDGAGAGSAELLQLGGQFGLHPFVLRAEPDSGPDLAFCPRDRPGVRDDSRPDVSRAQLAGVRVDTFDVAGFPRFADGGLGGSVEPEDGEVATAGNRGQPVGLLALRWRGAEIQVRAPVIVDRWAVAQPDGREGLAVGQARPSERRSRLRRR